MTIGLWSSRKHLQIVSPPAVYHLLFIFVFWEQIKPDVSTVCFGIAASQGALLLAGGKKGKRFAMPNARIMIHQPQGGCGVIP